MYIRSRKNASGSTSVFIVDSQRIEGKKHAKSIMVKSFGSSSDPERITALLAEAEIYKNHLLKTSIHIAKPLHIASASDITSCNVQNIGIKELYGTVFKKFFATTNLPRINSNLLEEIAIMRIAKPLSKLRTAEQAKNFGCTEITLNKIYKLMDNLDDKNISKLKKAIYKNTSYILGDKEKIDVLFYDLTTIYFETNSRDALREFGFSKDGKSQHVQITMALMVTKHGLPIGYELFPGNIYEGKTLIPTLIKLRDQYQIDKVSVVADSALMNKINLDDLSKNNFNYIISARIRNVTKELTNDILDQEDYINLGEKMRYKVIKLKDKYLISVFSIDRAKKDAYDRARNIAKAEKYIGTSAKSKLSGALKKTYFSLSNDAKIILDEKRLEEDAKLDGYFGFYTNLDSNPEEIIAQYKGLWQVEQTFRISKHNLEIRPVYHWNSERIKAHFAICFLALSLIRYTEVLLKNKDEYIPIEQLHQLLDMVKIVNITSKGENYQIRTDMPQTLVMIYRALGVSRSKTFVHLA